MVEIALVALCAVIVITWGYSLNALQDAMERERGEWKDERQMLLDRIQAPSFAEYTNKVVREKKAEQPEEKVEPVEFVS